MRRGSRCREESRSIQIATPRNAVSIQNTKIDNLRIRCEAPECLEVPGTCRRIGIAGRVLASEQQGEVSFEAFFTHVLAHELQEGSHSYTLDPATIFGALATASAVVSHNAMTPR